MEPGCLADGARLGFNVLGFANNHTMDYSYDGLEEMLHFLRWEGIAAVGVGQNLFEAAARVGSQTESMPGRISLPCACRLSTAWRGRARTGVNALRQALRSQGFLPPLPEGTMDFGPVRLEEVENEAQEGCFSRATCQAVVILVHSHEIKAIGKEEPDYFLEDFARQCIDAGASAVVGSGTHQVRGIEIYNSYSIFYYLGNFFFENDTVEKLPGRLPGEVLRFHPRLRAEGAMGPGIRRCCPASRSWTAGVLSWSSCRSTWAWTDRSGKRACRALRMRAPRRRSEPTPTGSACPTARARPSCKRREEKHDDAGGIRRTKPGSTPVNAQEDDLYPVPAPGRAPARRLLPGPRERLGACRTCTWTSWAT